MRPSAAATHWPSRTPEEHREDTSLVGLRPIGVQNGPVLWTNEKSRITGWLATDYPRALERRRRLLLHQPMGAQSHGVSNADWLVGPGRSLYKGEVPPAPHSSSPTFSRE